MVGRKITFYITWIVALFTWQGIQSQELTYSHFQVKDGLPSSEIYQSIQDERGYMWFASDRGLIRYDGYDFQILTTDDGLGSDVIFGFHKDHDQRIWMYTYSGGIAYLQGDTLVVPDFNDSLIEVLGTAIIGSMYVDLKGHIWMSSTRQREIYHIYPSGQIEKKEPQSNDSYTHITTIDSLGFIYGYGGSFPMEKKHQYVSIISATDQWKVELPNIGGHRRAGASVVKTKEAYYLTHYKKLVKIEGNNAVEYTSLPQLTTMSLFEDSDQDVWIGVFGEGVFRYQDGNLKAQPDHFLVKNSVSSIYEDSEGGCGLPPWMPGFFTRAA
ncbi:hypothetical protein KFE98_03020 [bacterium SCSIO 12741]|nr:hypothetical protein KFE98_03020 [bacterium SCSIO 12741]